MSYDLYGINVYKCKPFVAHPHGDLYPEKAFDLYLHCSSWAGGIRLNSGDCETKKLEIAVCFAWTCPKQYKKIKQYTISGVTHFEAQCITGLAISEFLIDKLGYQIENWK